MLLKSIKIGNRVEIHQFSEKLDGKAYLSQVEDIVSENELLIHMPIAYGQLVKLSLNTKLSFIFFTEKGMLRFEAEIKEYQKENELNFMKIKMLTDGEKIQRRAFFRFNCLIPLKFSPHDQPNGDQERGIEVVGVHETYRDGIIKDIGGGGVRFVSNEEMEEKGYVRCVIMLDDDFLNLKGKILNKVHFPKSNFKYQYRIEFVDSTKEEQDKIVKYIFNEERKLMKKTR